MKTAMTFLVGACFLNSLAVACGGDGTEVGTAQGGSGGTSGGTGGAGEAGSGGAGDAGSAGSGGTSQAGQAGAAGAAGQGGDEAVARDSTLTIRNDTADSIFVGGAFLPHSLSFNGEGVSLSTTCNCDQCNSGEGCLHGDPAAVAVEIPPNDSLEVERELLRYVRRDVTETSCPEVLPWDLACGEAQTLEAGTYQILVPYDTLDAIEAQGLVPTSQTQWGHTVWMEETPGIGYVELTMSKEDAIVLDDASPVFHTVSIAP